MNAHDFTTAAEGWLAAIATISAIAIPLYFKIAAQIKEAKERLDKHDEIQGVDTKPADAQPKP